MNYTEEDIALAMGMGIGFMATKHNVPQPEVHELKEIFIQAMEELHIIKAHRESDQNK